ncbi:hypothetical protein [Pseudomonas sp. CGJS7]|uniref:hypothetical protein n=1 Tax=Pseudomonas sp. CGJS7 TaxID=3109348 RepID=UPI00300B2176
MAVVLAGSSLSASASVALGPGPDLPMRRSAWLDQAMDSKTCPIVRIRPSTPTPAEGDAVMATVWRADDEDRSDLDTWPALHISLHGRPLVLRRDNGRSAVQAMSLRGMELSWAAPAERVSAYLRLRPPRAYIENDDGGWTPRPPGRVRDEDDGSTRTLWQGALTVQVGDNLWTGDVEVESICGP